MKRYNKPKDKRVCTICGKKFAPRSSGHRVCGGKCTKVHDNYKVERRRMERIKQNLHTDAELKAISKKIFRDWVVRPEEIKGRKK